MVNLFIFKVYSTIFPCISEVTLQSRSWYSRLLSQAEYLYYSTSYWSEEVYRNDTSKQVESRLKSGSWLKIII